MLEARSASTPRSGITVRFLQSRKPRAKRCAPFLPQARLARPVSAIRQTGSRSSLSFGSKASHVSLVRRCGLCLSMRKLKGQQTVWFSADTMY